MLVLFGEGYNRSFGSRYQCPKLLFRLKIMNFLMSVLYHRSILLRGKLQSSLPTLHSSNFYTRLYVNNSRHILSPGNQVLLDVSFSTLTKTPILENRDLSYRRFGDSGYPEKFKRSLHLRELG